MSEVVAETLLRTLGSFFLRKNKERSDRHLVAQVLVDEFLSVAKNESLQHDCGLQQSHQMEARGVGTLVVLSGVLGNVSAADCCVLFLFFNVKRS